MFEERPATPANRAPLAERARPRRLEELVGLDNLLGPSGVLRPYVEARRLPSMILWGPPGAGKTTLAQLLAEAVGLPWTRLSAVDAGVKEVRAALAQAESRPGAVLFIDEIHRFNKGQQDALLHAVERGVVRLIGATTENPSFEVVPALLSRCQVYVLEPPGPEDFRRLLAEAVARDPIFGGRQVEIPAWPQLFELSGADARKALNLLELCLLRAADDGPVVVDEANLRAVAPRAHFAFDKQGENHYDIASAFIKSIRGGDPNGALYWLARMIEGGQDLRFICRRIMISAAEDVGNANPNALLLATSCAEAVDRVGLPEARIILAQTVTYLACSVKSNAAYNAIEAALAAARQTPRAPVPLHLRNAPTRLMKNLDYGRGYKYTHDFEPDDPEARQSYLPAELEGRVFYRPKAVGREQELRESLRRRWGDGYFEGED